MDDKFKILQKVKIIPLDRIGKIVSMWIRQSDVQYEVRYFDNAETKSIYFYADELEVLK